MTKKKEVKKKKVNLDDIGMKGIFPEDMETTEIIEKVRTEWAKKLVSGSS
jgi:hypothetical protein